jgi:hypothetical protein
MKTYWGVDVYIHFFLTSALVGGKWLASLSYCFTLEKNSPFPIGYEVRRAPDNVWMMCRSENS